MVWYIIISDKTKTKRRDSDENFKICEKHYQGAR